jgi:hypothetical protein
MVKTEITQFNKANLQVLRTEIDNALKAVENQFGIKLHAGNASFSGNEVTFKLKGNTIGEGGTVITKEATNWDRYKVFNGMNHLSVGDQITIQGKSYTLTGYNTRAKKAPVEFKDSRGNNYKCSMRMLQIENSK